MHRRKKAEDVDVYVYIYIILGGGNSNIFFIFIPKIGEMIQFDEHIFQMGWNHQLELDESETKSDTPKIISKFRHFHTVDMLFFWWICSRYGKRVNNTMMIMFIHFWTNRTASLFVVYLQGMTCCKASLILNSNPSERSWFDSISILEMIRRSQDLSPVVGWNNIRDFWHFWWRFCFFHSHFGAVFFFVCYRLLVMFFVFVLFWDGKLCHFRRRDVTWMAPLESLDETRHSDPKRFSVERQKLFLSVQSLVMKNGQTTWTNLSSTDTNLIFWIIILKSCVFLFIFLACLF